MRYYWDLAGVVGWGHWNLLSLLGLVWGRPGRRAWIFNVLLAGAFPRNPKCHLTTWLPSCMHACIRRAAVPHAACSTSFVYSFRYHSTLGQQSSARDRKHPSPKRHIDERSLQTWHIRAQNRNLLLGRSHCGRGGECDYVGTIVRLVRRHRPW